MKEAPFFHQPERARPELAFQYRAIVDLDRRLSGTVLRVEMRWGVVIVVHGDDDSEKTAQFRQSPLPWCLISGIVYP